MTLSCAGQVVGWPNSDDDAPTVSSTSPESGATEVPLNAPVVATFSEAMDPATLNGSSFLLTQGATPVTGSVIYVGVTALFTPSGGLEPNLPYTATIRDTVTDRAGNHLAVAYTWSFTTGLGQDATAPRVTATNPVNNATEVVTNANIIATFSEAIDPATLTDSSFTLRDGATAVPGAVTTVGVNATFNPTSPLNDGTTYTATINNTVTDLAGNPLAVDYVWTFTAGSDADTEAPRVTATNPVNNATDVVVNANIIATFSEAMDPTTLAGAFTVLDGAVPVPGAVNYTDFSATFNPTTALNADTTYTATITTAATDLAGNPLAAAYVWTFTTAPDANLDRTAPVVTATNPVNNAMDVAIDANIIATFSEDMNPATLSTATFIVLDGVTPVPGTVTSTGVNASFNPTGALDDDTVYTATITTAAADLAGNTLVVPYTWTFMSGVARDTTPPPSSPPTPRTTRWRRCPTRRSPRPSARRWTPPRST